MNERKKLRKKQESFVFILMGLILLGLFVSGYFLFVEKILPGISSGKSTPSTGQLSGSQTGSEKSTETPDQLSDSHDFGDAQEITLYFGGRGNDLLVKETKKIPPEKMILNLASILIKELINGPVLVTDARPIIPPETQLRALFYYQGTFFVDFSKELIEKHPGGALEEVLTVYAIVSTLTELDKKAKVRILVNGSEVETLKGHVNLKQTFSRNEALIGSSKGI